MLKYNLKKNKVSLSKFCNYIDLNSITNDKLTSLNMEIRVYKGFQEHFLN